jgi:peptide/nickel transport system substrate-binding protein
MRKNLIVAFAVFSAIGLLSVPYSHAASAKSVSIAIGQEPTSIDPSLIYLGADFISVMNWGERMIDKDPNGELKPGIVTSWKTSPDGKAVEFTLRKGLKFHSGDPLTMKDVEFSFERYRTKNNLRTQLSFMERFEAMDDYRFRIHFKAPDVTFIPMQGIGLIVSKTYYDRVGEDKFVREPVGTGAYRVVRHVPAEYVDLERFDDFWGVKPSVEKARIYFVAEDLTRVSKLKAGEVDLIGSVPYTSIRDLEKTPGIKLVKSVAGHPTPTIQFNNLNPKVPWYDKRVRLAMAYAIDYDAIIKKILLDIPTRYAGLAPWEPGYDPDMKPYPYNPKRAKELLAEAGYPNGFDLPFNYLITGRVPMINETTEAIAAYFQAIGIRTRLIGEDAAAFNARRRAAKARDAVYVGLDSNGAGAGGVHPLQLIDANYNTTKAFSVYSNPEFDRLMDEARAAVGDPKKEREALRNGMKILYDDVARIPLYNYVPIFAMKENIDFLPVKRHPFELTLIKNITVK